MHIQYLAQLHLMPRADSVLPVNIWDGHGVLWLVWVSEVCPNPSDRENSTLVSYTRSKNRQLWGPSLVRYGGLWGVGDCVVQGAVKYGGLWGIGGLWGMKGCEVWGAVRFGGAVRHGVLWGVGAMRYEGLQGMWVLWSMRGCEVWEELWAIGRAARCKQD